MENSIVLNGVVTNVSLSDQHSFHKFSAQSIELKAGFGVLNDVHGGTTVKHRSRVKKDPTQPNLRQVHLIHQELFTQLADQGFTVTPALMGENITTSRIPLLALSRNTILHIGATAQVQITGLRNPCNQLEAIKNGLMKALLPRDESGNVHPQAGIMGVVLQGGVITKDDTIRVQLPEHPFQALVRV